MIKRLTSIYLYIVLCTCISLSVAYAGDIPALSDELREISDHYENSVFTVNAYVQKDISNEGEKSAKNSFCKNVGTAFSFGYPGYLVTLHCVVENASKIVVAAQNGKISHATLIDTSPAGRISVLKLDDPVDDYVPVIELGNAAEPKTEVMLMSIAGENVVPLRGMINKARSPDGSFVVDAMANEATSGAPVFDSTGKLLGLLAVQVEEDEASMGLPRETFDEGEPHEHSYVVIPAEYVWVVSQSIINSYEGVCGWLGIKTDIISANGDGGVVVNGVIAGSPAERFGLQKNDRIIRFNGGMTPRFRYLMEHLTSSRAGESVDLTVTRGSATETIKVILAKQPGM